MQFEYFAYFCNPINKEYIEEGYVLIRIVLSRKTNKQFYDLISNQNSISVWGISSFGRAFGSQSKGNGFDSRILHKYGYPKTRVFVYS